MTMDNLAKLNEEGWPVKPGDIGENITLDATTYDRFSIGMKFLIGDAELQISKPITPCITLGKLPYVGMQKRRQFVKTLQNRRGWYARVLKEGTVRIGDEVKEIFQD